VKRPSLVLLSLFLVSTLTACAPATAPHEPQVAVINGPAQGRLEGSAAALEAGMRGFAPLHFGFVSAAALRFAEGHSDLFYDRAVTAAGRIARSYGAPYAVVVGASTLDRQVTLSSDKGSRSVSVTLRMQALVVDAATDTVVSRVESQLLQQVRYESTTLPLPDVQHDPTVASLRDEGADAVAPAVVGTLWHQLHIRAAAPLN